MGSAYADVVINGRFGKIPSFFDCFYHNCDITALKIDYNANLDKEWLRGTAICVHKPCQVGSTSHTLTTSDTREFFNKLNNLGILNPLASIYFYGILVSGEKYENGHSITLNND